jgi:hypothetical protein
MRVRGQRRQTLFDIVLLNAKASPIAMDSTSLHLVVNKKNWDEVQLSPYFDYLTYPLESCEKPVTFQRYRQTQKKTNEKEPLFYATCCVLPFGAPMMMKISENIESN